MTSLKEQKYKDASPHQTIHNIRSRLLEVGILTTESNWLNSLDGFYSVTVSVDNSSIQTNGKGITKAYALASAYGELMERLQNFAPFRLSMDFHQDVFLHNDFYYAPDEIDLTLDELIHGDNQWFSLVKQFRSLDTDGLENLLIKWQQLSYEPVPEDYKAIPYTNIDTGEISYIPIKMANKMYMSNGMCAGNTRSEALIQGISEILERYVNQRMIREKITPPTIPETYLYEYPHIMSMIHRIERNGQMKIIVKDCSLGEGYPVTCVLFIDQKTNTYFIKFGASPVFDISLERTLTELLQGQDIRKMKGLKEFYVNPPVSHTDDNIMNILVNGSGYYPKEMFMDAPSYLWKGFNTIQGDTNDAILDAYITTILTKGYTVLVRDVSFLGFPSYHVIIPGLSEVEQIDSTKSIHDFSIYNTIKKQVRSLHKLAPSEVRNLIYLLTSRDYHPMADVTSLLNLKITTQLPWYYSNMALFLVSLYLYIKDYANGATHFRTFLDYYEKLHKKSPMTTYYRCVCNYLELRSESMNDGDIYKLLVTLFPTKIVARVIQEFENTMNLYEELPSLQCFQCDVCSYQSSCQYPGNSALLMKLKDLYGTHFSSNNRHP